MTLPELPGETAACALNLLFESFANFDSWGFHFFGTFVFKPHNNLVFQSVSNFKTQEEFCPFSLESIPSGSPWIMADENKGFGFLLSIGFCRAKLPGKGKQHPKFLGLRCSISQRKEVFTAFGKTTSCKSNYLIYLKFLLFLSAKESSSGFCYLSFQLSFQMRRTRVTGKDMSYPKGL